MVREATAKAKLEWWETSLPWRSLGWHLPLASLDERKAIGLVVHRRGQFGWSQGDWVSGSRGERSFHFGLDIIGWIAESGQSLPLSRDIVCCSPLEGVATIVEPDEHNHRSVVIRHSSASARRRRFSFFGDLEEIRVKKGQKVAAGAPLGRPCLLRNRGHRFFHFGMGYELEGKTEWHRLYINPRFSIEGAIEVAEGFHR